MRLDRILALIIAIACVVTAIGNWFIGMPPESTQTSDRGIGADIALLEIYGPISDSAGGSLFETAAGANAYSLIQQIQAAEEDQVKGILLLINSPGGTTGASQAVYQELMRVREETPIKIVASFGDVAASGAYYIASAAHRIVANPASITGSIGVIIQTQNIDPLLEKIGIEAGSIQSGQYKDILSPYRATSPTEQKILQEIVGISYQQFLEAIAAGRKLPLEQIKPLADGRIFTGSQALAVKLVDALGNSHTALDQLSQLTGIQGKPKVRNYSKSDFWESWFPSFSTWLSTPPRLQFTPPQPPIPLSLME